MQGVLGWSSQGAEGSVKGRGGPGSAMSGLPSQAVTSLEP